MLLSRVTVWAWISFCNGCLPAFHRIFFNQVIHSIHYSMKSEVKKNLRWYFKIILVLLIPIVSGSTNPPVIKSTCPGPQVSVTSHSTGSVSFSWNAVSEASEYVVFYVRQGDNYTSQQIYTGNTSITYSGLPSGTYNFYFAVVCGSELSAIIIIDDLVI